LSITIESLENKIHGSEPRPKRNKNNGLETQSGIEPPGKKNAIPNFPTISCWRQLLEKDKSLDEAVKMLREARMAAIDIRTGLAGILEETGRVFDAVF